ncbi:MgtC/SapB family protein [Luteimonas sp. MJ246]|uniref:MgtC/SapB family protein n=1 Tax=Luteimonas sp. MJ174 TaxID=3129237 RepID=UPI0031BAC507
MDVLQSTELWILARVAAAMALGGVLGIERELGRHAAGLRTHMMIAGAAALIVGLGDVVAEHFTQEQYRDLLRIDPGRLIESVVAAVGFVGAGAILRARGDQQVRGLTTASSLLMAAAIGIAAGLGNYLLALGASLLCVLVLAVFRRIESRLGTNEPKVDRS